MHNSTNLFKAGVLLFLLHFTNHLVLAQDGCTDVLAVNYSSEATVDDGSCLFCSDDIASYTPIHFSSAYNASTDTYVAQVFTATGNHVSVVAGVSVDICPLNTPTDMLLELAPFTTEPDWNNPIASVTVPYDDIPQMSGGCSVVEFDYVHVLFENVNLISGTHYALVMKGTNPGGSVRWQRAAIPDDPVNPYPGGNIWEFDILFGGSSEDSNHDLGFSVCEYTATPPFNGCTDPQACNYDPLSTTDDGSCTYPGCLEPVACNYDPLASCSDANLCEFLTCQGCTYPDALNYDPAATLDDGSCNLPGDACIGDLNGDQEIGTSDLLELLAIFGTSCP